MNTTVRAPKTHKEQITYSVCSEAGVSVLETAIVLPFLITIILSIIQFGYIFASYITVRNATAVAARHAVLDGATQTVENAAEAALAPMLSPAHVQGGVQVDPDYEYMGFIATKVDIEYRLPLFFRYVVPGGNSDGTFTIHGSTVMR